MAYMFLKNIIIPNSVTSFGTNIFSYTISKKTLVVPLGTTIIPSYFLYSSSIETIYLPNSITIINSYAFGNCFNLKKIVIESGLLSLEQDCFRVCNSLESITLPSSLTSISTNVFINCSNLQKIILYSINPPTLSNINIFTAISLITKIYVPDASVTTYKTSSIWLTYANYIYPISQIPI